MNKTQLKEVATCRGCGRSLIGEPYYKGQGALIPETMEEAPVNFYGGYVCSYDCDYRTCLEMESSMPGAGSSKGLGSSSSAKVKSNWNERF